MDFEVAKEIIDEIINHPKAREALPPERYIRLQINELLDEISATKKSLSDDFYGIDKIILKFPEHNKEQKDEIIKRVLLIITERFLSEGGLKVDEK